MIIPFFIPHAGCPHQCVFCDQRSITGRHTAPPPESVAPTIESRFRAGTVYEPVQVAFYGGSFTALPLEVQRAYLEPVQLFIASGRVEGIRVSTRPDAITDEVLEFLKQHHIGTVELGVQSMDDTVLTLSGRGHTAADTENAVRLLKGRSFTTGLQLMPGLPGDSREIFNDTVAKVIALKPDFVRLYPALVIRDTPLEWLHWTGRYTPLSLDEAVALCGAALVRFRRVGIAVIRIGLQPTEELERPGTITAGPFHPAFRQLVESSLLLEEMCSLLPPRIGAGGVTFVVNPADLSPAIGQKHRNIRAIRDRYGLDVKVMTDPRIPRGAVRTEPACKQAGQGV